MVKESKQARKRAIEQATSHERERARTRVREIDICTDTKTETCAYMMKIDTSYSSSTASSKSQPALPLIGARTAGEELLSKNSQKSAESSFCMANLVAR